VTIRLRRPSEHVEKLGRGILRPRTGKEDVQAEHSTIEQRCTEARVGSLPLAIFMSNEKEYELVPMMTKELESPNQAFVAFALAAGVRMVRVIPDAWFTYILDDSEGKASRALGLWRENRAIINAKDYASAMRRVREITKDCRKSAQYQEGLEFNGNRTA